MNEAKVKQPARNNNCAERSKATEKLKRADYERELAKLHVELDTVKQY